MDLKKYIDIKCGAVDRGLDRLLPKEKVKPSTIHKAMRYSIFAGGKRLRPVLCIAAAEACGGNEREAMPLACAVECIHTYSLIHDDLPGMDNDDFRRGRPTSHKVFGEGIAILAGDALLTEAFVMAAKANAWPRYSHRDIVAEMATCAGSLFLVGGQVADLEGEGKKLSHKELVYIHERKTAALLSTSIRLGAFSANATPAQLKALTSFGYHLGLAFQVIDDILDCTKSSEELGKTAGKDEKAGKATYPSILGMKKAEAEASRLTRKAMDSLRPFGAKGRRLHELATYLLSRQN
ncbi:MAG: polyprenyl synthetase family protein [Verrucomicrobiae bacterium]|nr:polyprenyl synthetase family protein [Verrucomicrobiae bacterium]